MSALFARIASGVAVFRQVPPTFAILWRASKRGTIAIAVLSAIGALIPAAVAYTGKLIVDGVVLASRTGSPQDRQAVLIFVALELLLMTISTTVGRGQTYVREILEARLYSLLSGRIVQKALELELRHFEDSEVHDKMQNARREANYRPLKLVTEAFSIIQSAITLIAYAALLVSFSPWSILILLLASIPSFVGELRFAGDSFRINSWRAPEFRKLNYLEWILTRDSHVKEVKLFDLGGLMIGRYRSLFSKFFDEDRKLARRRLAWGLALGLVSMGAFYGCYAWVAGRA